MALLFASSFEHYTTVLKRFSQNVQSGVTAPAISAGNGRHGASLRITGSTGTSTNSFSQASCPNTATGYIGFAMRHSILPTSDGNSRQAGFVKVLDAGNGQASLAIDTNGHITAWRGDSIPFGSLLGTSTYTLKPNVWYYIEWKITINNTTGVSEVRVNGTVILSLTSQNTRGTGSNNFFNAVGLGCFATQGATNANIDFDDFVVNDDGYTGDVQVREEVPTGTGDVDNGTATGAADTRQAVDDAAGADPNDDTDYSTLVNVNDKFLLTFPNLPTSATVKYVYPMPYVKKSGAGTCTIKSLFKISGVEYPLADQNPSDGTYQYFPDPQSVSPATSVAWTASEVNGAQMGVKRTA